MKPIASARLRKPAWLRALLVACALGPLLATGVHAASSEPIDLDPELQALVARSKIQQRGANRLEQGRADRSNRDSRDDQCGSVDIGNNTSDSRTARGRLNPRTTNVIVTGPVINTARCR